MPMPKTTTAATLRIAALQFMELLSHSGIQASVFATPMRNILFLIVKCIKKSERKQQKMRTTLAPPQEIGYTTWHVKPKPSSLHVVIALNFCRADNRLRMSGVLRFLSSCPDVDIRILDTSPSSISAELARLSNNWNVDGIVFTVAPEVISTLTRKNGRRPRPIVAMMDGLRTFAKADIEIRFNTKELTDGVCRLLRRRGFRHFAFCGTNRPQDIQYSSEVEHCFRESAQDAYISSFHEDETLSYSQNMYNGADWIGNLPKPCGIMCYSDVLARELLTACNLAHVNVPRQVAIVGLDDTPEICETTRPTLTSALPDFELSGYLAAQTLYEKLHSGSKARKVLSYGLKTIVERESTQDLRHCGRHVTAACELIRRTPPLDVSVDGIVKSLGLSRRLLEMHFREIMGHGIHAEITKVRLEAISKLLVSSQAPIGEISMNCGFNTLAAAQVAFKKCYGVSMRSFRQSHRH